MGIYKNPNYKQEYYQKNKELIKIARREYLANYYKENRNLILERVTKYQINNAKINGESTGLPQRNSYYKRTYGITYQEFLLMSEIQNDKCMICLNPESITDKKTGRVSRLSVDHDHNTGKIRGLLCRSCNIAIGNLNDDPALVLRALNYLKGY